MKPVIGVRVVMLVQCSGGGELMCSYFRLHIRFIILYRQVCIALKSTLSNCMLPKVSFPLGSTLQTAKKLS